MSEIKNLLYYLLADNINYNNSFDIFMPKFEKVIENENDSNSSGIDISFIRSKDKNSFITEILNNLKKMQGALKDEDEDFFIDSLISTQTAFFTSGACFGLAAVGTPFALPALLNKMEADIPETSDQINFVIKRIQKSYNITPEMLEVLKDGEFKHIKWNKPAMNFFCLFKLIMLILEMDIEDPLTETLGDFLIQELKVDMDGFDSFRTFRICHLDTEAYFNEMRRFENVIQPESLLGNALKNTEITANPETDLKELYHEIMVEFLNIRLIQGLGTGMFRP
jgi:hypothetical protein